MVTPPSPGGQVCGREDGFHLLATEKAEQGFIATFARNRENPLGLIDEVGREFGEAKAHEGANGGQSSIARAAGIVAFLLQMFQERQDRFGAKGFESDLINRQTSFFGDEVQEQFERISIGRDGVQADLLGGAQVREELSQKYR